MFPVVSPVRGYFKKHCWRMTLEMHKGEATEAGRTPVVALWGSQIRRQSRLCRIRQHGLKALLSYLTIPVGHMLRVSPNSSVNHTLSLLSMISPS
jgi:hypothetical protein